ncbi:MAG: DUF883 family protein [Verrucomicrobiota bacterium]|jgi:ElaB/YqjD/DUF883 family membrane-anchored ribosome-binding protein
MSTQTQETNDAENQLAEDASALINATAGVAGEKVGEARKRLTAALERAKEVAGRVREKAVAGAKAADECVREHPYQSIAVGVGLGLIVGYILGRRGRND